jgi:hypothetical protein
MDNENHCKRNSRKFCSDKQGYVFLIARGGAGTGKSIACRETRTMVRDALQSKALPTHFQYSIFLLMDYSNVDKFSDEEIEYGTSVALALRIFLKLFHNRNPSDYAQTQEYQFLCKNHLLTLNLVLQLASQRLHEYFNLKSDVDIPIMLLLDEYQKIRDTFLGEKNWKHTLRAIGDYCVDTAKANEN